MPYAAEIIGIVYVLAMSAGIAFAVMLGVRLWRVLGKVEKEYDDRANARVQEMRTSYDDSQRPEER